ncbi:MAG: gliding motility-associated C-terminal domain-containing protein [Bacteroidia bacterium]|nr:gliding motility-associated C-terminal domain-containing protein [Bacteroidia bacterium]
MKALVIINVFFFTGAALFAQSNLVPNWSFEDTVACPTSVGQLNNTTFWFSATNGTPDYYNECATLISNASVPQNGFGYQYAKTGVAYTGVLTYQAGVNSREYIEAKLIDSLRQGKKYCVSFYVSLASGAPIDAFHAVFSNDTIFSGIITNLSNPPDISNPSGNMIADTTAWVLISGTYISSGGENYITIGNFYTDANSNADTSNSIQSYFYIDDVSVILCEDTIDQDFFIPTAFSPNGDNNNDILHVRGPIRDMDFYIYDRWGELVYHSTDPQQGWDGSYEEQKLNSAVFVYYFKGTLLDGTEVTEKGNITLFR